LLNGAAGVKIVHVPYKGTGPAMTDVMGGHIDGMVTAISGVIAPARSGKLRVLAVTGDHRAPTMPEVLTAQEQGLKGFTVVNWYAIVAPAHMQPSQLNALHGAIVKTVANPSVREKLLASGVDPKTDASPAAFAAFVRDEFARWGRVVSQTGAKME
jgi:tripartite-type tricarboxylate transporter receptor subunit TctC